VCVECVDVECVVRSVFCVLSVVPLSESPTRCP